MENYIKQIYLGGLPEDYKKRILWVEKKFRTNRLSLEPGGCDLVVEYFNGDVRGYDRIKFPYDYIYEIFSEKGEDASLRYIDMLRKKVNKIFVRKYKNEDESKKVKFKEIWNSKTSTKLPWDDLRKFNINKESETDDDMPF